MAKISCMWVFLFMRYLVVLGQEPHCNKFSFEEQLLEKMVRLEFKVETMFGSIEKSQQDMKNIAVKVDRELTLMRKAREQMKVEMNDFKIETNKRLDDAAKESITAVHDFEAKIGRLSQDLVTSTNKSQTPNQDPYVTYIRWGRTICPGNISTIYSGFASGSHYTQTGGPSHTICLPKDPEFGKHHAGGEGPYLYNAEYERADQTRTIFGESMANEDVPCAVCESKGKSALLMIPARMECYEGWTKEYSGYLMTDHHTHQKSDIKCIDEKPEKIPGQSDNNNGELFYFVEAAGNLPDPPYTRGVEITCVVCTR